MNMLSIEADWPQNYDAELLPGLPGTGPEPSEFAATPQRRGREGVVVRVRHLGNSWVGNFQRGDGKLSGILATPSADHLCVIASGRGYCVPIHSPTDFQIIKAYPIQDVRPIPELRLLVFSDYTDLVAYGVDGLRWSSGQVSWDGIAILRADAHGIVGTAWDARRKEKVGFFVDAKTGRSEGGAAPPTDR